MEKRVCFLDNFQKTLSCIYCNNEKCMLVSTSLEKVHSYIKCYIWLLVQILQNPWTSLQNHFLSIIPSFSFLRISQWVNDTVEIITSHKWVICFKIFSFKYISPSLFCEVVISPHKTWNIHGECMKRLQRQKWCHFSEIGLLSCPEINKWNRASFRKTLVSMHIPPHASSPKMSASYMFSHHI